MLKLKLIVVGLCCAAISARAAVINTNSGFLGTFSGPHNGDFNVVTAQVTFNGSSFVFTSTMGAPIGTTTGVDYIWGVDRGLESPTAEAGFGLFAPGVLFDGVVILSFSGGVASGFVDDIFNGSKITALPAGAVTVSGNTITALVPLSLLPAGALLPAQYQVNLWPSLGIPGPTTDIAEFAPSTTSDAAVTVQLTATPAPTTITLVVIGLLGLAGVAMVQNARGKRKASFIA
jgi:hypothetical protein